MPLINHSIPNLFNGVSQQAASIRQPSQCEIQENCSSSIVEGLHKRHPTVHAAKLNNLTNLANAYVHVINRDSTERYVVVIANGTMLVYDMAGNQKTCNYTAGAAYLSASTNAREDFSMVTVADYTFVVNKTKKTELLSTTKAANPTNVAYFHVAAAPAQHTITAVVDGISASASLGTSGGTQGGFAASLASAMQTALGGGYTITRPQPELIKVVKSSAIGTVSCSDTYGNQAIRCLNNGVQRFSDLPTRFETGFVVTITGELTGTSEGYFVEWSDTNQGYIETIKPGSKYRIDNYTMPHQLVRNADGTFTFGPALWNDRTVGNPVVNKDPSFIGLKISDVFFFRNRLGFLADENVVFSRAGDFFSFFPETTTQVLDSDPVDAAVSHVKVSLLKHAIPFNKNLVLFSDLTQFMLTAQDVLTPKTVAIHQTTEFECSQRCKPVAAGSNVYFAVEKSGFTSVREYYVMPYQQTYDADDVTAHVPKYIPGGVYKLTASTNDDVLFALSDQDRSSIYVYKWYWRGEEKLQSSWSKWKINSDSTILNMEMIGTKLYLVIQRPDGCYLEYIDIQTGLVEDDMDILVHLDRKVKLTGTYDAGTNRTYWTLPYQESNVQAILGGGYSSQKGVPLTLTQFNLNTWYVMGNYSGSGVYFGIPYMMRYRFSQQYAKDNKNVSYGNADLRIRNLTLFYTKSGFFQVEVTPLARDTYTYQFTGKKLGSSGMILGSPQLDSGTFRFPVMTDAATGVIDIVNDTYLPCFFQSAEWEAFFNTRSQRM